MKKNKIQHHLSALSVCIAAIVSPHAIAQDAATKDIEL